MDFMPFGKHKGKPIDRIPLDYLEWGYRNLTGGIQRQFADELGVRGILSKAPQKPNAGLGTFDCSHLFNPDSEWPGRQEWDGVSAPWDDQNGHGELDREFRAIVS